MVISHACRPSRAARPRRRSCSLACAVAGVCLAPAAAAAQQPAAPAPGAVKLAARSLAPTTVARGERVAVAFRSVSLITIDGRLSEPEWARAEAVGAFVQQRPDPDGAPTQHTEVRVLYDDEAVYVGMRLHDGAPDSIAAPLGRRDYDGYSDWAQVLIDSYHDRRTAFRFAVNPSGVKRDTWVTGDQESPEDPSWDAVWDAVATRDSLGWTAEFRIPLTQLRFSTKGRGLGIGDVGLAGSRRGDLARRRGAASPQSPVPSPDLVWGIQFIRDLARRGERSLWAPVPPGASGFVSHFGTLEGLRGLRAPRRLEVMPYSVARLTRGPVEGGDPLHRAAAVGASLGADVKYGVTSNLTLTATLNPDFGQVEADPSEVNLTGLETFFTERRPFFVEGADIFNFDLNPAGWLFGREQLFYSRRIGRAPQGSAPEDARYSDAPTATTILGAAKLSGKTAGGWSVGLLTATTGAEDARYVGTGGAAGRLRVEPLTNYTVARAIKDFRHGESAVGAVLTATHRRLTGDALDWLRSRAYAGGVNARHRFGGGNYTLDGYVLASRVRGSAEAIALTQDASAHYLRRPGATHLTYDSTRTALSGAAATLRLWKNGGGHWRGGAVAHAVTPGFEVNDLGFQGRSDYLGATSWIGYDGFRSGRLTRNWEVWSDQWVQWSLGGEQLMSGATLFARAQLHNFWEVAAQVRRDRAGLSVTALRGGPALYTPARSELWYRLSSDRRRAVSAEVMGLASVEDGTGGRLRRIAPTVTVRPSGRAELSLQPAVTWSTNPWQYVATADAAGTPRYVVGRLEQTTAALTARASYTFTRDLSLQLYAQPFLSGGDYRAFHEVRAPAAARLGDRFRALAPNDLIRSADGHGLAVDTDGDGRGDYAFDSPSYDVGELRSNAVLRWEYRPGSAFFVVWIQSRASDGDGPFALGRDAHRLLAAPGTNTLLVKLSYWFNP